MWIHRSVRIPESLDEITTIGAECKPEEVGMTTAGRETIWDGIVQLYRTRTQPAISVCIRREGRIVLDRSIGHQSGNAPQDDERAPKVLATPQTPFCIFSASKAVTAMVIHLLDQRGVVHIDDPVTEYIPEFGRHGKEHTSIRHVLTHRAGVPSVAGSRNDPNLLLDWDLVIELLCNARPEWVPGRRLAYHAITGGFILGEIVRRVTKKTIREVLTEEILAPLGFRFMGYGVAEADVPLVAQNAATGWPVPFPFSQVVRRAMGVSFEEAVKIANDYPFLTGLVPSGNVVATAEECSRFYQLLLNGGELDGVRIFEPRTIRRACTESSYMELDLVLGAPVRYGLGLQLGAETFSLFGPHTTRAFGHLGFINNFTWADPERQLAVGLLTSGKPFFGRHLLVLYEILERISRLCPPIHH
ncbi:MAG: beta-lactamase family protein [Myxococcales bacterium]|nr:beta-lactamase family protein [Myxococcales bacterium]